MAALTGPKVVDFMLEFCDIETDIKRLLLYCYVKFLVSVAVTQLLIPVQLDPMDCTTAGSSLVHYLREFAQIHVMLSNHLFFSYPLLLLPSIFPSIRVFSNESAKIFVI